MRIRQGDLVEFELGYGPSGVVDGYPRWLDDDDRGSSGRWCQGVAATVSASGDVEVHYLNPLNGFGETWLFSAFGFRASRPGWLRSVDQVTPQCECGAQKTYGRGPHSTWCPCYEEQLASDTSPQG